MKADEMDAHRLVPMMAAGVLDGVRIHRQLVNLSEENRVLELGGEHFLEHRPALRGGMERTLVHLFPPRHLESAPGTATRQWLHPTDPSETVRSGGRCWHHGASCPN